MNQIFIEDMKKNNLVIPFVAAWMILVLFPACSNKGSSEKNNQEEQKRAAPVPEIYKKPPSSFPDTIIITGKSAVFFTADTLQLKKIKEITGKVAYENNVHDCFYQMRNARMVLKKYWSQVHIIETSRARYILFNKANKNKTYIDLNNQNDQCGIFLFDPRKNPQLADMMNIDTELGFYFVK